MLGRRSASTLVAAALGAALLTGCDIVPASGWALDLVTVNADGTSGGNAPTTHSSDVSADGTKVLFTTKASNLGPNDTNDSTDVYLRDLTSGTTTLISANAGSTDAGDSGSSEPRFSPAGTKVAFSSSASNLGPSDTTSTSDIYIRDLTTGAVTRIDPVPDPCGDGHGSDPTFSPDGTKVAFTRRWSIEAGQPTDVFVHDLGAGTTVKLSRHQDGAICDPDSESGIAAFSPDSRQVAFVSTANDLGPTDSAPPSAGFDANDVYLHDLASGATTLISVNGTGADASNHVRAERPLFNADGARIVFTTTANDLGPTDTDSGEDIYMRDLATGTTDLVSANADGTDAANGFVPAISPDGTKVAFTSAGNTHGPVDSDTGVIGFDAYVRDLTTGVTSLVSVNAAGTDSGNGMSGGVMFAGNDKVAFTSRADDLASTDTDQGFDLFLRDLTSGATTLLSANALGTKSGNGEVSPGSYSASADGSVISFVTSGSNHGDPDTNGFEDIYVVRYHDRANLSVNAESRPEPVASGGELSYHVGVANAGPESAHDAAVFVALPEGTTLLNAEASGGACTQPVADRPDIVACELGDLPVGSNASAMITAGVTAPAGSSLTAVAAAGAKTFDPVRDNVVEVQSTVTSGA